MKVEYFKATEKNNRFNKNQIVWIGINCANHLFIYHKFRGSGRYVSGKIDKDSPLVGELKSMEVDNEFAERILK
tara:strand:- start:49 stop:270 length:222 start_codon:yes stop_codon:yes gene_type:complete